MKNNSNNIGDIVQLIQSNVIIYKKIPFDKFEEQTSRIVKRLIMQKELFIKEIANAADKKTEEFTSHQDHVSKSYIQQIFREYKDSIATHDVEGCISLLINIEQKLYDRYATYLFEEKPDEITRMILKNQSNEIKRDIRILNNMHEYV